ncbi:MAG: hypothetical protein BA873_12475 [Desulfobulbaceae bacterium C00003063]|nr:MAG: hypothetical protein BA873_12475 [Desulfobulbaceae bacterium C00003063]
MENRLRDSQLAALGKLLAGYTHELKNHLAIINESSGLMDDLLEMSEGGDDKLHERFKKIIITIGERISQANTMAMYLNRVAHRMDVPASTFNVNDLLIEELALMNRFAAMKQISFELNLQEDIPSLYNNPSLLQFMIFSLVNELLETLESGSAIRFFSSMREQDVEIIIESGSAPVDNGDELVASGQMSQILDFAAGKMNIGFNRQVSGGEHLKFTLTLPIG